MVAEIGQIQSHTLGLREKACKSWDYFISDKIVYTAEIRDVEHIREQEGYINNYIEGRLWFEIVFHGILDQEQKLVWLREVSSRERVRIHEPGSNFPTDLSDNPMLVIVHQILNDTEKFCLRSLPSVIRLKVLDSIPRPVGEEFDIIINQPSTCLVRVGGFSQAKREIDPRFLLVRERDALFFATLFSKRPSDMVKRGTQVTQNVTNNQAPTKPNCRLYGKLVDTSSLKSYPFDCIRKLRIAFSEEGDIWLGRGTTDSRIKATDVLVRPLSLELGAIEWMHLLSSYPLWIDYSITNNRGGYNYAWESDSNKQSNRILCRR